MSKTNLRSTINLTKDKYSLESRLTESSTLKSLSRGSFNNSSNPSSSSNSIANISVNFMKDSNFPKLFSQSSMLFSFNGQPQTTTNSTFRNSIGFSGLGSGSRTPSSSLSSFNNLFEKDHLRKNSLFGKKTNDLIIDISKKKNLQKQNMKNSCNSVKKQLKPVLSLNTVTSVSQYNSTQAFNDTLPKQECIRVFVRIKPCQTRDLWIKPYIMRVDEKHVDIEGKFLAYDYVFPVQSKQQEVFQRVAKPVLTGLFQGFNGTIFAYGQTGSGKTHTIFGGNTLETEGLISRSIKYIFSNLKDDCKVSLSLLEIYKQDLFDLLNQSKVDLKIKQTQSGVSVEGLTKINIKSLEQTLSVIQNSLKNRKVASTKLNQKSSRSHTMLTIYTQSMELESKLCLIDLAGSEKANKAGVVGQNFQQMKKINYSLSCLGNVINALVTRKKTDHIPFRDSKLTRMLKDSLSGKFRTSIIVNCSSDPGTQDQTMSSLKFADRAKKVKITLTKCNTKGKENVQYLHKVIQQLTTDLQNTKRELNKYKQICVQKPQQTSESKRQNQPKKQKTQESPEVTARQTIPSERANLDLQMKKYSKQEKHINVAKMYHKQKKRQFFPLSELSSLNVSKSTIKVYGQINSPSVSSLSYRPDEGIDDFSFHFSSVMKEEQKLSCTQNQQKN